MRPIKLLIVCVLSLVTTLFATGIERIYWMFSGSGSIAVVPQQVYRTVSDISCDRPSIEVKRDPDGVMRYRCGSYWLLSTEKRSPALTAEWKRIANALKSNADRHP